MGSVTCRTSSRSRMFGGGKSGLHRAACRLTAGGAAQSVLHGQCHRKYTAPLGVRVKWCGKSAPRPEQSGWQGKPHAEQDQIGEEERPAPINSRVGRSSRAVMFGPDE